MTTASTSNASSGELAPNYFLHTLENGLEIVGQRMPSLASVTFGIQFNAGIKDEPEQKLGLTHLLSDMVFQGTEHRNVRQLTEDFEAIGARKGGETGNEFARYSAQIVGNRLDRAFDLMADVVRHPTFPEEEFQQMRAIQLQEIRRRDDEPMRRIFDLVRERFYSGTTLGRRGLGLRETVEQLQPDDLRAFWQARYRPQGALVSIAGNFDWDHVVARVAELFGDWSGATPQSQEQTPNPRPDVNIEIHEGNQEHIGMAFPFPKYGDPDYYAASVVSEIFGGGMTSRLFREVREKRGLAYAVGSYTDSYRDAGMVALYVGTREANVGEAFEVIGAELARLGSDRVPEEELKRAKESVKGRLVLAQESTAARMSRLAGSVLFDVPILTLDEMLERIDGVTAEELSEIASDLYRPERFSAACIGRSEERFREALAPVSEALVAA
jgi:predicted Zn-dependent peptidase